MMSEIGKWKNEWHLYSAVGILATITFIVIQFTDGTPKDIGLAFSGLVGLFLFASESWKSVSIEIHQWTVIFSLITIL